MLGELALRSTPVDDLKSLDASVLVVLRIISQRAFIDVQNAGNHSMRKIVTLQQQRIHFPLDPWMGMVKPFMTKCFFFLFGEMHLKHGRLTGMGTSLFQQALSVFVSASRVNRCGEKGPGFFCPWGLAV